jgi:hypothetical protein
VVKFVIYAISAASFVTVLHPLMSETQKLRKLKLNNLCADSLGLYTVIYCELI